MSERRTRPAGWLRSVCRAAAVLVLAGLLGAPGAGARSDSLFAVTGRLRSGDPSGTTSRCRSPRATRTWSSSTAEPRSTASRCLTARAPAAPGRCTSPSPRTPSRPRRRSGGGSGTPPTRTRSWGPTRRRALWTSRCCPRSTNLRSRSCSTLSRVGYGDDVTARFSPIDPKTTITTCSVLIAGITLSDCTTTGTDWSLPFTVPGSADVGSSTVEWSVVYERGEQKRKARGTTPFTVLPP